MLTNIINVVLKLHHFSTSWKTVEVGLVRKSEEDSRFLQTYHFISLLPTMGKVLEKILLERLLTEVEDHIPNEQFEFRPALSTVHQLLRRHHKAFDKLWHTSLLCKLLAPDSSAPLIHILAHIY